MHCVLVVDDDADVRESLAAVLSETYRVRTAGDGRQALAELQAGGIDAVLLDLMMPVMDGLAVLAELERRASRVPVILVTAAIQRAGALAGVAEIVEKPFDLDALEEALRRVLARAGGRGGSSTLPPDPSASPGRSPGDGSPTREGAGLRVLRTPAGLP